MPDFSNLTKQAPVLEEREYKFEQLEGTPVIWSLPATELNKPFYNESLRRAAAKSGKRRKLAKTTTDTVAASREEDRELLATYCAKRWQVKDASGNPVDFSTENCLAFFRAIPDYVFDDFRNWAVDPTNWTPAALDADDVKQLGETSPSA